MKYDTLLESTTSNTFKLNTAGYILEDGTYLILDSYHGEDEEHRNLGLPEFSNTHPEEDTCIRLYKEPNDIQYQKLEEVIEAYLDSEGYCKIEMWNNALGNHYFYKIYTLFEGACTDKGFEEIEGNWSGEKLVSIIKNNINKDSFDASIGEKLNESLITEATRAQLIDQSRRSGQYKDGSGNRWTAKANCKIANTVADYNKIDMDTFFKKDILKFGVRVEGETDTYIVTILFKDILKQVQDEVNRNKNKLDAKIIYDALMRAITRSDVLVGCTCPDYNYRFRYWATKNGYNAGQKETRIANLTNPDNDKGAACKHILAVLNNAEWLKKVASVIHNYINYCKDHMEYNYSRYIFPKIYNMNYEKAVQMTFDDYDENGNIKDNMRSDEEIINLSNALGKVRGRFKKGSNKNPVTQEKK